MSSKTSFACPSCGTAIQVPKRECESTAFCTACGTKADVPWSSAANESPSHGPPSAATAQDAVFVGFVTPAASVLLCLLAALLKRTSLEHSAEWLLWLSWWILALFGFVLFLAYVNLLTEAPPEKRWSGAFSTLGMGVVMLVGLWGHDMFYKHMFPLPSTEPVAVTRETNSPPPAQQVIPTGSLDDARAMLHGLEERRAAVQNLLDKAEDDRADIIFRLRQVGVMEPADLKGHAQGRVLYGEWQRLVLETDELIRAVVRFDEAILRTKALIRSMERSQILDEAGMSDDELTGIAEKLLLSEQPGADEPPSVPIDPIRMEQLLVQELSRPAGHAPLGKAR